MEIIRELFNFDPVEHRFTYAGSEIPGTSRILEEQGYVDLSGIPPDVLERAKQIGTEAHKATEIHDLGGTPECHPLVQPCLDSYILALEKYKPKHLKIEESVMGVHGVQKPNGEFETLLWGGVLDRLWETEYGLLVVDIKTSYELHPSHKLQVCSYSLAEGSGAQGALLKIDKKGKCGKLVILTKDEQADFTTEWLRLVESYYFKKKVKVLKDGRRKPFNSGSWVRPAGAEGVSTEAEIQGATG
jgi:hypothetical protein